MNEFTRCNKVIGVHWLKEPIGNVKIKIKLKSQDNILSLPKFEDYANDSASMNFKNLENQYEEYNITWQEKVFSLWELQRYSEPHNCISDVELRHNDTIKQSDCEASKIFTYVDGDVQLSMPINSKSFEKRDCVSDLGACFESMKLSDKVWRILAEESSSMGHLFRSEENLAEDGEQWMAMHVVFDNSEYTEDNQLLVKQECTLLSIYHNTSHNYVIIKPDVNDLDLNPYVIETTCGPVRYKFSVDINFNDDGDNEELIALLNKLFKKWEKKHKLLTNFTLPPIGRKYFYWTLEIISANDFEQDNLYVEFNIKIPELIKCEDILSGRTHVSKSKKVDGKKQWHFGHLTEFNMESDSDPPPLQIFFEVISTDWWGRHYTEGYYYLPLTLSPGRYTKELQCTRPEEMDRVEAESRRFFLGGCHLIKDLDILIQPQLQDAKFKYVTSGSLFIQWSVVSQVRVGTTSKQDLPGISTASNLLQGAEAVLRKYKKARARLAAATKNLEKKIDETGDGS